jgi:hypothetical protein
MAKKYLFIFSDGHQIYLGSKASEYCDNYTRNTGTELVFNGFREKMLSIHSQRNDKISGDGFKKHYSPELGWISSQRQFDKKCKEKGFTCAGNEPPPQYAKKKESFFSDKDFKKMHKDGVKLSGNEVKKLKEL